MTDADDATILTDSAAVQASAEPVQYGRYRIVSELGRGAMGVVYKAHDPQIDRTIALKVLRPDRVTSSEFVRRFLKEAMAVGRLSHPGIVTVYDVGQDHGTVYIAMEFLEGRPLDELMTSRRFTLEEIVSIGVQTARALHYAHQRGIIHRDIKPPNIIYSSEGILRVTDFGIARIEDTSGGTMTQVGEILGTPRYMSPEQIMGQELDGRSDLYSLGVILYQLTTGKRPFQGETLASIFRSITQDVPEPPHVLSPELPEPVSAVIMRLLEKDPASRFADGNQLIAALDQCLPSARPQPTAPPPPPPGSAQAAPPPNRLPGLLAALAAIALIGGGGYFAYDHFLNAPPRHPGDQTAGQVTPAAGEKGPVQPPSSPPPAEVISRPQAHPPETLATETPSQPPAAQNPPASPPTVAGPPQPPATSSRPPFDAGELLRDATVLSAIVSELPKKELVVKSAQELAKVSPRYQEDLNVAENTYNNVSAQRDKRLELYANEIQTLSRSYSDEEISNAFSGVKEDQLSARQKSVLELAKEHLKSLKKGDKLSKELLLKDFTQRFETFVD